MTRPDTRWQPDYASSRAGLLEQLVEVYLRDFATKLDEPPIYTTAEQRHSKKRFVYMEAKALPFAVQTCRSRNVMNCSRFLPLSKHLEWNDRLLLT